MEVTAVCLSGLRLVGILVRTLARPFCGEGFLRCMGFGLMAFEEGGFVGQWAVAFVSLIFLSRVLGRLFFFFNLVKTSNGLLIDFHHRKAILRLVYLIGKVMAIFGNNNIFSLKILII